MDTSVDDHDRRRILQGVGAVGIAGIAGCMGGDDSADDTADDDNGDDGNGDDGNGTDPDPAHFEVSDASAGDVTRGESLSVSATVENTGDELGDQEILFVFDGEDVDSMELSLDGDESETVSFDLDTTDYEPDEYEYEVLSDDDGDGGTVSVDPVDPGDPLLEFDDVGLMTGTDHLEAALTNPYPVDLEDGNVEIEVPDEPEGWAVSEESGVSFETLAVDDSQNAAWTLEVPDDADGEYELTFHVTYTAAGEDADVTVTQTVEVRDPLSAPYGINFGHPDAEPPEDPIVIGDLEFEDVDTPDDLAQVQATGLGGTNLWEGVEDTEHTYLYETEWWANTTDFEFDLDFLVEDGLYDLTFHFADPRYQEEGARVFDVSVQGELFLEEYDIYVAAGGPTPVTETIEGVVVTDNMLSIETISYEDAARLSALEIRPAGDVDNLLENASFEEVEDGAPIGWGTETWDGEAELTLDDSVARSGEHSVRIDSESGMDGGWNQTVAVEPDTDYVLAGWVRTEDVENLDDTGFDGGPFGGLFNVHELGSGSVTDAVVGTQDWTLVSSTINSGGNDELQINCLLGGYGQSTGTVWFDDVMFWEA